MVLRLGPQPGPALAHLVPGDAAHPGRCSACTVAERLAARPPRRLFHLGLLVNWNTPMGQPADQARRARPNAAVDLPLPSPVCTISSGWARRCRVVSPSSGNACDLALWHQAASFARMIGGQHVGRLVARRPGWRTPGRRRSPAPRRGRRRSRRPGRGGPAPPRRRRRRWRPRPAAGPPAGPGPAASRAAGGPAVGDDDQQRPPGRVAPALAADQLGDRVQAGGERRLAADRQVGAAAGWPAPPTWSAARRPWPRGPGR